jgi:hypothetical protein
MAEDLTNRQRRFRFNPFKIRGRRRSDVSAQYPALAVGAKPVEGRQTRLDLSCPFRSRCQNLECPSNRTKSGLSPCLMGSTLLCGGRSDRERSLILRLSWSLMINVSAGMTRPMESLIRTCWEKSRACLGRNGMRTSPRKRYLKMRFRISSTTTGRTSTSTVATKASEVGSDAWMTERGFRETTPEEHRKFAKFFPTRKPFYLRFVGFMRHRFGA